MHRCKLPQVLAEILQQRARVYDPHAASRKDFVRCCAAAATPRP